MGNEYIDLKGMLALELPNTIACCGASRRCSFRSFLKPN